jgi:hypothetical protein
VNAEELAAIDRASFAGGTRKAMSDWPDGPENPRAAPNSASTA